MEVGKVPNEILNRLVLDRLKHNRKDVLVRPKIGEDCSVIDFGDYICVLSTDPITGAANEIGRLAVHVACNDIASSGVEPMGLLVTILAPIGTTQKDIDTIMSQLCETANSINIDILGGHTEITSAVNRFVISSTSIGKAIKGKLVTTSGAKPGDSVILTKSAGIEGTAIIAHDKEEELVKSFGQAFIDRAKSYIDNISVIKEGLIASEFGVSSMHDVTEGGVLGAVWEVSEASDTGMVIYKENIHISPETSAIAQHYNINPLKLISSGCMLITCKDGEGLVRVLNENNINASIIGVVTEKTEKKLVYGDKVEEILSPNSDELYKVIG